MMDHKDIMKKFVLIENLSIVITILILGVMAGFFWTYTFNVNMAMLNVDGKTYAQIQSLFNENVRHAVFFIFFFGGGVFSFIALIVNFRHVKHSSFWLLAIAFVIYVLGVIIFTAQVNLPLNYYTESWVHSELPADWSTVRDSWNHANAIRVATSFTSFLLCVLALCIRCSHTSSSAD